MAENLDSRCVIVPDRPQPTAPRGFEEVERYWDPVHGTWAAKLFPGECYVSTGGEVIVTILGSCVAACIRDAVARVGGMNHFLLPEGSSSNGNVVSERLRYGSYAMERLVNGLLNLGASRERLEVKVFGGGKMLDTLNDLGASNVDFVLRYLQREGLQVKAQDVKGDCSRKVYYWPDSGRVRLRRIARGTSASVVQREQELAAELSTKRISGHVEFFS